MSDRFGYGEIGLDIHPCRGCEDYEAEDGCKSNGVCGRKTNADRIRAMTDEELADELLTAFAAFYDVEWSKEAVLDWLRQEVI